MTKKGGAKFLKHFGNYSEDFVSFLSCTGQECQWPVHTPHPMDGLLPV